MKSFKVIAVAIMTGAALVIGAAGARADSAPLEDKVKQLEQRIAELEGKSTQVVMQASVPSKTLDFLGQTEISGFVSASYLYNFKHEGTVGRLYDVNHDQFSINKFKLSVDKPVDFSPTNWAAGYQADLIFGQDAAAIHSSSLHTAPGDFNLGKYGDLEQAYVQFNAPVGNGLKVLLGKMVTCMGVEVVEEVANPNWSIGNQFIYVENTTQTGLQLQYKWSDKFESDFCLFNGWDVLPDNNTGKSLMGRFILTPNDKTSLTFVGYGGPEQDHDSRDWRSGLDIVFNRKLSDKLNMWLQGDYGHEDNALLSDGVTQKRNADWYAGGLWLTYDCSDKVQLAGRVDYLKDKTGHRTGSTFGLPAGVGTELFSGTLTLTYKPVANLQIRPEVRWDHASKLAFNGSQDQYTAGIGVAYLY